VTGQPGASGPVTGQPGASGPVTGQPGASGPMTGQPGASGPVTGQPGTCTTAAWEQPGPGSCPADPGGSCCPGSRGGAAAGGAAASHARHGAEAAAATACPGCRWAASVWPAHARQRWRRRAAVAGLELLLLWREAVVVRLLWLGLRVSSQTHAGYVSVAGSCCIALSAQGPTPLSLSCCCLGCQAVLLTQRYTCLAGTGTAPDRRAVQLPACWLQSSGTPLYCQYRSLLTAACPAASTL